MDNEAIYSVLKRYWGYDSFRPTQLEIITSVLQGNDTLGLLPTGGGKSITFQVPAMLLPGVTVVVTPLISLMKDQVDNLIQRDIKALYLHAGMTQRESRLAISKSVLGKIKLLYLSPEKLRSPAFLDIASRINISLIVVDEAHCISQWGYDFRPSYLKIADLRAIHPDVPVLALTASATPNVAADIRQRLLFKPDAPTFQRSFSRDNLSYVVRYGDFKEGMLLRVLRNTRGSAIVYVRSRRRTVEIARTLTEEGIQADYYHAGLSPEDKNEKQNRWKDDTVRVMVATNAFGMGIDKPDVRVVVHIDPPSSLEEYYQEAGRAGRDGLPAFAVLLAAKTDKRLLTRRISQTFPPKDYVVEVYEKMSVFLGVGIDDGADRLFEFNFNLFCTQFRFDAVTTVSALQLLTQAGYIEYVEEQNSRPRVMMLLTKAELYSLRLNAINDRVMQALLRLYSGIFADYVFINEGLISHTLGITDQETYDALLALSRAHVIHYIPRRSTPSIYFPMPRIENRYIQLPNAIYADRRRLMEQRIDAMKRFIFDTDTCRVATLLGYFGEPAGEDCGQCDVCRERQRSSRPSRPATGSLSLTDTILYLASHPGGTTLDRIVSQSGVPRRDVIAALRALLDTAQITFDPASGHVSPTPK